MRWDLYHLYHRQDRGTKALESYRWCQDLARDIFKTHLWQLWQHPDVVPPPLLPTPRRSLATSPATMMRCCWVIFAFSRVSKRNINQSGCTKPQWVLFNRCERWFKSAGTYKSIEVKRLPVSDLPFWRPGYCSHYIIQKILFESAERVNWKKELAFVPRAHFTRDMNEN